MVADIGSTAGCWWGWSLHDPHAFLSWLQDDDDSCLSNPCILNLTQGRAKRCMPAVSVSIFPEDPPNDFTLYFTDKNYVMWLLLSVRKARKYVLSGNISMFSIVDSVDKQGENGYWIGSLQSVPQLHTKSWKILWTNRPPFNGLIVCSHRKISLGNFCPKGI